MKEGRQRRGKKRRWIYKHVHTRTHINSEIELNVQFQSNHTKLSTLPNLTYLIYCCYHKNEMKYPSEHEM
jgi:hypothetical protein